MVTGGNATAFMTETNRALSFYADVLRMKVASHYGGDWATVEAGGFTVGLHPKDEKNPDPVDAIEAARLQLVEGGALEVGPFVRGSGGAFVHLHDLDGDALYLWSMEQS